MNTESIITDVMARIAKRRLVRTRFAAVTHGLLSMAAIIALVPAYQYISVRAAESGFSAYLSLLASDSSLLVHSWQTFGLTLVESAPIAGCAIILGILLVLAYSVGKMFHDFGTINHGIFSVRYQ